MFFDFCIKVFYGFPFSPFITIKNILFFFIKLYFSHFILPNTHESLFD